MEEGRSKRERAMGWHAEEKTPPPLRTSRASPPSSRE